MVLHVLLDYLKCRFVPQSNLPVVLLDQATHLSIILAVLTSFGVFRWTFDSQYFSRSFFDRVALVISGYVISIWVGGILVRILLSTVGRFDPEKGGAPKAGIRIG